MPIVFTSTIFQLVLSFAILAVLTAVTLSALNAIRKKSLQCEQKTENHLNNFREMKNKGELSTEEFRKIRRKLSAQFLDVVHNERQELPPPSELPEVLVSRRLSKTANDETQSYGNDSDGGKDTV